jgi:hypothetical protein
LFPPLLQSAFAAGSESSLGVESDLLRDLLPAKNIPSDTTQRHIYLKTILFFSTYNNLQAKGKKQSSCINYSLSATLHLSEKFNQHLQLLYQQRQYHPGHASSNLLHASLQLINIAVHQLLLWIETCS